MRIGYIGHFGEYHTEWGVSNALERYAEVDRYHYQSLDRIKFTNKCYDLILTSVPHCLPVDFWQAQKGKLVAHYFDLIVGWWGRDKAYFPALKHFDLVLSTDGSSSVAYQKAGINRKWLLQAVNPEWYEIIHHYQKKREVAFIGGNYGTRPKLFAELSNNFDFQHFNGGYRGIEHSKICATSKIMVADNAVNNLPGYWSNRVYLHLASGAFVLHPNVPGMNKIFQDKVHLVYYNDREDLIRKIRYYLSLDGKRNSIAKAGHELVMNNHTWDVRVKELWRYVSEL